MPPGPTGRPEAVSISTFRDDGWLNGQDAAALVRVATGPAQVLVTVYQAPSAPPDSAPRLQVMRLGGESGGGTRAPAAAGHAAPQPAVTAEADVVAHVQRTGDVPSRIGEWAGTRGSRLWIEGFSLTPHDDIKPSDLEYQAVLGRGWLSPWIEGGKFCGSRGMALPLLGLKVRLKGGAAKTHECSYSASFVDGSAVGPVPAGEACEAESLAALEAFQIVIHRRGERRHARQCGTASVARARASQPAPSAAKPADKPAAAKPADKPTAQTRPSRPAPAGGPADVGRSAGSSAPQGRGVKYLFVHQNFPGQYLHIVRHLAASRRHDVVFLTEPNVNQIAGVRTVPYPKPDGPAPDGHVASRELDAAVRRADVVARTAANLKQLGFDPDIIIGHHGWGELLNIRDIWPDVPLLGYLEFYYCTTGIDVDFDPEFPAHPADFPRIRAKNAVNLLALNLGANAQTPTKWQLSTYPEWAREQITLLPEGVNLDVTKPNPQVRRRNLVIGGTTIKPTDKLVTYVSRDLEPYRGFHLMMRAIPHLLRARKDIRVVMVGADGVSYGLPPAEGTWRQKMLAELGDEIDPRRVLFPGRIDYQLYTRDAATLGCARLSELSVRGIMVIARGAGHRLCGDRQRHANGARIRHARARTGCWCRSSIQKVSRIPCCACWMMRCLRAGCAKLRGSMRNRIWRWRITLPRMRR